MKNAARDVDGLARSERLALRSEAHLAGSFNDEVDLFLLLVVPRHLAAFRIKRDIAQREMRCLDGAESADDVLSKPPGRVTPSRRGG